MVYESEREANNILSHEKKQLLLSIESWLVHRDPYNGLCNNPYKTGHDLIPNKSPKQPEFLNFHCSPAYRAGLQNSLTWLPQQPNFRVKTWLFASSTGWWKWCNRIIMCNMFYPRKKTIRMWHVMYIFTYIWEFWEVNADKLVVEPDLMKYA